MRLRLELFVDDLDASVAFYTGVLGFAVSRRSADYVSLRRGLVTLGLGPIVKLGPTGHRAAPKGTGVEIVLELDSVAELVALHEECQVRGVVAEALCLRPWGLRDFRLVDPDGYYLRVTHGNAAQDEPA
jgi:catechol 2,3-dioxygenase-like lactoylglutathione lyase family enzyme